MDRRIVLLILNIDNHNGNVAWNLKQAWAEIRLDISPAYASRLFKRCTGQGIREYAKKQRLQLAAERLAATEVPVKIIAAESGYQLSRDFTRTFKGQYHQSPTEYRKKTA